MGYTNFGKTIKKMMIDNDENLGVIAKMFNVSTAFVSSVLIGKKAVPDEWYEKLCEHYVLNEEDRNKLFDAYCETKNSIKLDLSNMQTDKRKLAMRFQRELPSLSEEELESISFILKKEEK